MDILDCTFRDGGYYGNWNFARDLIQRSIYVSTGAGIELIELGFRFPAAPTDGRFFGRTAFSTDRFLSGFDKPATCSFGVMVNMADFVERSFTDFFTLAEDSPVDFVRIATKPDSLNQAELAVEVLTGLGYQVWLNLMGSHKLNDDELIRLAAKGEKAKGLYLADSNGAMMPAEVRSKVSFLKSVAGSEQLVGFHAHDNMGLALANSFAAIEAGASIVDGTYRGMGRGAGNAPLELLINALLETNSQAFAEVCELAEIEFSGLQREYNWGTNSRFMLGGRLGIHPNQVIEIDSSPNSDHISKLRQIELLGIQSISELESGTQFPLGVTDGGLATLSEQSRRILEFSGISKRPRTVLLLGPGESKLEYMSEIRDFVEKAKPLVLSLGGPDEMQLNLSHCHVESNPLRMLEASISLRSKATIFANVLGLPGSEALASRKTNFRFDYQIEEGERIFYDGGQLKLPGFRNSFFALGIALAIKPSDIVLAGFDGFGNGDSRDAHLQQVINNMITEHSIDFSTATPSSLMVRQSSWIL